MKTKQLIIFYLFLMVSSDVYSASGFRNGGDAVVCFNSATVAKHVEETILKNRRFPNTYRDPLNPRVLESLRPPIELIDLYLARRSGFGGNPLIDVSEEQNFIELANERLGLARKKSKRLHEFWQHYNVGVPLRNWIGLESGIVELHEFDLDFFLPTGCLLIQVALQRPGRVYYDRRLFDRMEKIEQAALLVHEHFISSLPYFLNAEPADVHEAVALLFSKDFDDMSTEDFEDVLLRLRLLRAR